MNNQYKKNLFTHHINHRTTVITVSETDCIKSRNSFPFSFKLAAANPSSVQANIRPEKSDNKHSIYHCNFSRPLMRLDLCISN